MRASVSRIALNRIVFASLLSFGTLTSIHSAAHAQLSVRADGNKTVSLSDKVGKNQFEWTSEAPLEKIVGTAEGISGTLTLNPRNPATLRGSISAQVVTMKTGNDTRDGHLKSPTWLDATKYPKITFTASSVSNVKPAGNKFTADVTGNFTLHGVTKQLTVPVTLQYIDESAKTRERAPGDLIMMTAAFNISLKDYNVAGSKGVIGNQVGDHIQINAKLFGSTGL